MVKDRVDFDGLSSGRRPSSDSSLRPHIKLAMATNQSQDCNHSPMGQLQRATFTP